MEIPVLVEPTPGGFRAAAGAPLDITADGPTADAALAALRMRVATRLAAGAEVRTVTVPDRGPVTAFDPTNPAMTPGRFAAALAALDRLRANPMYEEFERTVAEYHRKTNVVPDPDDPSTHWPPPPDWD